MGVDVDFFIEVKRRDKWQALVFQTPASIASYQSEDDKGKEWLTSMSIYGCRYYHFQDFLEDDIITHALPDDCSEALRKHLNNDWMGKGYFKYDDLNNYCQLQEKEMLNHLLHSRDYQMVKQINRIEKAIRGKAVPKSLLPSTDYYSEESIEQVYEEYMEEHGPERQLLTAISTALDIARVYSSSDEIRIIYGYG